MKLNKVSKYVLLSSLVASATLVVTLSALLAFDVIDIVVK